MFFFFDQRIKTRQAKLRHKVFFAACEEECNQFSSEDALATGGQGRGNGLFLEKMVFPPHPFLKGKALGTKLKGARMLVVSLRGVNFGFWTHLGCSGQTAIIFSLRGLFQCCTRRNIKKLSVCVLKWCFLGVKKRLDHAQIDWSPLGGLIQNFGRLYPAPFIWEPPHPEWGQLRRRY